MEDIARSRSFQSQFFVNIETREGWTPLAKCAAFGYVAAVQELLAMGADLHYETRLRHTAMTWASYCGHEAVVLHLLRIGVNVDQKTRDEFANGFSPLVLAASLGNVDLIQLLLRFGADVNFETSRGRTPLSEACIAQDPVIVKMLIDHRASVTHTNRQGRKLLQMA
eukprot:jgi/Phyca11/97312/e_gw1.1.1288.1